MYMYVCVYVCVYVYIYMYVYVYMCIYVYVHVYVCMCMYMHVPVSTCIHKPVWNDELRTDPSHPVRLQGSIEEGRGSSEIKSNNGPSPACTYFGRRPEYTMISSHHGRLNMSPHNTQPIE